MLKTGDTIVHARYGAGEVVGIREIKRDGKLTRYICIELAEERGMLMIPDDQTETDEIRPAMTDTQLICQVMNRTPNQLDDNHRTRQHAIEKQLKSGNPRQITQALRDLCWREITNHLTQTDSRLKTDALKRLLHELALNSTALDIRDQLTRIINQAMNKHRQAVEV
ncbi:MAG: hypothetical protein Kow00117_23440 [Phototrophicales bacterium]